MSEVNENIQDTEQELNEQIIEDEIDNAEVMSIPIDDTLTISGEAADAKAVGDALEQKASTSAVQEAVGELAGDISELVEAVGAKAAQSDLEALTEVVAQKADKSELQTAIKVNGQGADAQGLILLNAEDIPVDDNTEKTVAEALEDIDGKTGADIPVRPGSAQTIAQALDIAGGKSAEEIPMSESDPTTVAQAIAEKLGPEAIDTGLDTAGKAAESKAVGDALEEMAQQIEAGRVKTVNQIGPDEDGNVELLTVQNARELLSSRNQRVEAAFRVRTAGGAGSVSSGPATLLKIEGNQIHEGYVPEVLQAVVSAIPRPTPAGIVGELNKATFEDYVVTAGTYSLTYAGGWSASPTLYGVTLVGVPVDGDEIRILWDGENDPEMTIILATRTPEPAITATIDRAAFLELFNDSMTATLYYTTEWSEDPEDYALTIENTPLAGDSITITYVRLDRGTITTAKPEGVTGTGWNLYDQTTEKTPVVRYSELYGYKIGGTYTAVYFALTEDGTWQEITPDANGLFMVPSDGWVYIDGGDEDTYLFTTWSDWTGGYDGEFEPYVAHTVDLSDLMDSYFSAGLLRIGDVADEIDFETQTAISRVQRIAYSDAAYEAAQESGRAYDADTDYIYLVRATPLRYPFEIEPGYQIDEHGLEIVEGTDVPVTVVALYGVNLRDKLERIVPTVTMTVAELKALAG